MPEGRFEAPAIDVFPILPELILVGVGILVLLVDAVRPTRRRRVVLTLSLIGVIAAGVFAFRLWTWDGPATVLGGMVAVDRFAVFFRLVILSAAAGGLLLSHAYLARTGEGRGEYEALLLFATSGMTLLAAAADLIVVFLGLEVLSLSLYVMCGFSPRRLASQEASLKYFLLGAFSSAFFLYGVAFAYGATGTTSIGGIGRALSGETDVALALIGAGLLAVGFGFKVAAVPFHMWTPDVYQGAPTPVTGFMAAGTKVAGFAALLRVTTVALGPLAWDLRPALWWIAVLTMILGSTLAIAQADIKRMLAYSSIAHAGFVLVGVVAANQQGVSGAMFYLAAYAAMILGSFGVVLLVSRRGEERTSLTSYAGLAKRSPGLAALLALFLLSLAGIPPAAGFIAKVLVFQAAVTAGQSALVVIAVLASVVAAFFYLRVIVLMYMQDPEEAPAIEPAVGPGLALGVTAIVTLVLGVYPGVLLDALESASILRW
ncbi:MAG TPA: NADH-quinone oxidoreductase subunit NuoN [Actinomycetota bacterium]|jgi:NADH-quinone oxidoreductase subunit N|nr:NADH-quinone oxidoreductase subunit NuoN [Actinomycetota bacterium]